MFDQCWLTVYDVGPTLVKHWFIFSDWRDVTDLYCDVDTGRVSRILVSLLHRILSIPRTDHQDVRGFLLVVQLHSCGHASCLPVHVKHRAIPLSQAVTYVVSHVRIVCLEKTIVMNLFNL